MILIMLHVDNFKFANFPFERGEILFSKGFFDFSDIRKLQDKAKTSTSFYNERQKVQVSLSKADIIEPVSSYGKRKYKFKITQKLDF